MFGQVVGSQSNSLRSPPKVDPVISGISRGFRRFVVSVPWVSRISAGFLLSSPPVLPSIQAFMPLASTPDALASGLLLPQKHGSRRNIFHLPQNMTYFPLLVVKGIYHWTYLYPRAAALRRRPRLAYNNYGCAVFCRV